MTLKQIGYTFGILVVLAIIFGIWASFTKPIAAPVAGETHVLQGTKTANGDYVYTEDKDYYTIMASYPAATGLEAQADIKARAAIEQGLVDIIAQFKQDSGLDTLTPEDAQVQGLNGTRKYALDLEYKMFSSASTVSYVYAVYADTLGAHPNGYFTSFVFDGQGNQVGLKDVLAGNPNWLEELSLLVSQDITAQLKERLAGSLPQGAEGADVTDLLYPEGVTAKEENFENFAVDGDTLVIFIPPYQVAAYAVGSFEVRIPLSEINK